MSRQREFIYICPCGGPTLFDKLSDLQIPSPAFGDTVADVPEEIGKLYEEARRCTSAYAYTSAVLACRKLLMHIAVQKGAPEGKRFVEYVEYLSTKGYVPPDGKGWVDHIRTKGNEATHEIVLMGNEDAQDLINFTEMLLKFIYEFPARVDAKNKPKQ
jgi:hypothetical protein